MTPRFDLNDRTLWPHELKLQRASEHFDTLRSEVHGWEEGDGYNLWFEVDGHAPFYEARAEITRPVSDESFSVVIGDVLQNARAALDYLATALGDLGAGGVMDPRDAANTQFPLLGAARVGDHRDGRTRFLDVAKRRLPTLEQEPLAEIERLQPYNAGGTMWAADPLWILNELARFDRHRFLQVGVVRAEGFRVEVDDSHNVDVDWIQADEGPFEILEAVDLEDAAVNRAMGFPVKRGARLARFQAEPIDANTEMDLRFTSGLKVVFDADHLPENVPLWGNEGIVLALWDIVPKVEEVFEVLGSHLPSEPPEW